MANCECGRPVYIKKTGECNACYLRRYWAENPQRAEQYKARAAERAQRPEVIAARKALEAARKAEKAEAARDRRPFEAVLLEKTEAAFHAREVALQKRREWNARNADKRAAYRREYSDPNKAERNRRTADLREAATGKRSAPYTLNTEQRARKKIRMKRWVEENRQRVNAQNAERARARRLQRGVAPARASNLPCECGRPHFAKGMCKSCYAAAYRRANRDRLNEYNRRYYRTRRRSSAGT